MSLMLLCLRGRKQWLEGKCAHIESVGADGLKLTLLLDWLSFFTTMLLDGDGFSTTEKQSLNHAIECVRVRHIYEHIKPIHTRRSCHLFSFSIFSTGRGSKWLFLNTIRRCNSEKMRELELTSLIHACAMTVNMNMKVWVMMNASSHIQYIPAMNTLLQLHPKWRIW